MNQTQKNFEGRSLCFDILSSAELAANDYCAPVNATRTTGNDLDMIFRVLTQGSDWCRVPVRIVLHYDHSHRPQPIGRVYVWRDGWIEAANINGELAPGCSPMLRDGEQFPSIRYYAPAVRRLMAIVSEMGAL
jgi:hypothetical protein